MSHEGKGRREIGEKGAELRRSYEAAQRELGKDEKTKRLLEELSGKLRDAGTSEGRKAVRGGVTESAKATDTKTDQDVAAHQRIVEREAKPLIGELREMSDADENDVREMREALGKIEASEAKRGLESALEGARGDAEFTRDKARELDTERARSEEARERLARAVRTSKLRFRE